MCASQQVAQTIMLASIIRAHRRLQKLSSVALPTSTRHSVSFEDSSKRSFSDTQTNLIHGEHAANVSRFLHHAFELHLESTGTTSPPTWSCRKTIERKGRMRNSNCKTAFAKQRFLPEFAKPTKRSSEVTQMSRESASRAVPYNKCAKSICAGSRSRS